MSSKQTRSIKQLNNLAVSHHQAGRLKQASRVYRRILKRSPYHFDTLHMLGVLNCQIGESEKGLDFLFKALKINPHSTMCLLNVGKALHDEGRAEEAVSYYQDAISIDSNLPEAHNNLANALNDIGLYDQAINHCAIAIQLKNNFFEAYNNIGIALFKLGRSTEAKNFYKKALNINPDFPEAYNNLGNVFSDIGQLDDAINCYKQALRKKPDYPEAFNNLGIVLNNTNRPEEAIDHYKKALSLRPDYYEAMGNLAFVYERTNKIEKAIDLANQAIKGYCDLPTAHLVIAKYHRRKDDLKAALKNIQAINLITLHSSMQAIVLYEKGAICDRLGDYEDAFQSFTNANFIRAQHPFKYNIEDDQYITMVSKLEQYMLNNSNHSLKTGKHDPHNSDPVFIIGFPRSGTTLLDKIVGSHPQIKSLEEKPMVPMMISRMIQLGLRYPEDIFQINGKIVQDLREAYFEKMSEFTDLGSETYVIDKYPLNTIHIALIHRIFPNAKFIFALRHPGDVCLSCFLQDFKLNEAMSHFLDLNNTAKLYIHVMDLWHTYISTLPIKYHVIKYEELIAGFDEETHKLFRFLDIEWDPVIKEFYLHATSKEIIPTPSYHQVSEPLYSRSVYRWKKYKEQLRPILNTLQPYIERFGYSID